MTPTEGGDFYLLLQSPSIPRALPLLVTLLIIVAIIIYSLFNKKDQLIKYVVERTAAN